MGIDMTIGGDPGAIRGLGDWLAPELSGAASEADLELAYVWGDSQQYWTGAAGSAFRDAAMSIRGGSDKLAGYLGDAGAAIRAYANRIERGQEDFAQVLANASTAGLPVLGSSVMPPTTSLQYCPGPGAPEADLAKYEKYTDKIAKYNEIGEYVGTWWGELEAWIAEHLAPLVVRVEDFKKLPDILDGLTVGNEDVVSTAFEYASARTDRDLTTFLSIADRMQTDADVFRAGLRSGNPAVRAAAEAANPRAIREGLEELTEGIRGVTKWGKAIPIIGGAVDIVATGVEIANGGSPSSGIVGLLAGLGGGAVAGAAAAGTAFPPVIVAIAVGGLAWAAAEGGTWLYEAWVPLDTRESIDDFLSGGGSYPTLVSPTGSWAVGTK